MNPEQTHSHEAMINLIKKNNELLEQNQVLLIKIDKRARNGFWVKLVWYLVLFGLPLLFYSYFINGIMAMSGLSTGTGGNTNPTSSLEGAQKVLDLLNQK